MITRMTSVRCLTIRCREFERISRIFHCRILIDQLAPRAIRPGRRGIAHQWM